MISIRKSLKASRMPKAVITILGMIGVNAKTLELNIAPDARALYRTDLDFINLNRTDSKYTNTLPLLIESFSHSYNIIPIATTKAKDAQSKVLMELEKMDGACLDKSIHIDDDDFYGVFKAVNDAMESYEEVIFDVSHGFRHLPIMATIALVSQNIITPNKISHILFAQEIEQSKEYKIIDLAEYLDIALASFTLASFEQNYTVAHTVSIKNQELKELFKILSDFSAHILANSMKMLFGNESLVEKTIKSISAIENKKEISPLGKLLGNIKKHLTDDLLPLSSMSEYKKGYRLAEILADRGYLLNTVTILNEALPLYVLERINDIGLMHMEGIDEYQKASAVGSYMANGTVDGDKMGKINYHFYCTNHSKVFGPLSILRDELRRLRNDLAHANGSTALNDVRAQIKNILGKFEQLVIVEDIGSKLTIIIDKNLPPCRMLDKYFEDNAVAKYKHYFKAPAPQNPFERNTKTGYKKFETILLGADPKEWRINRPLGSVQIQLLDILQKYEDAIKAKNESAKNSAKEEFYNKFDIA
jgi:CRISPR-associated DxTHG motif protein